MDFNILGELQVLAAGRSLTVGGPRERKILAALLVNANGTVSVDRLIDVVWEAKPPPTSRNQIRNRISHLRRDWASAAPGADEAISTEGPGYRLEVPGEDFDAARFEEAAAKAEEARLAGDPETAAGLMREGLAEWRGPALSGIDASRIRSAAQRLDNRRLTVLEDCLACELELGRHTQVLEELATLAAEHPFRERLVSHLMAALYRSGRRAAALTVYRETATLFRDELGVDPGAELRQLHEAVLRDEPASVGDAELLDPVYPLVRPAELPADLVDFTGRAGELGRLNGALSGAAGRAVPILAITGGAGVGKTALAVHWAQRVAEHFPDGQLYLDLRGRGPKPPLTPLAGLASLLRSLGAPADQLPMDVDNAGRMYRSLLSGRRMLVVLDNVATAGQVRPLLPGSPGCLVMLTSRDNLTSLTASNGARRMRLGGLDDDEAVDLLAKVVGKDDVTTDPQATAELARSCAYLPRELRNAAAHVSTHNHYTIRDYLNASRPDRPAAGQAE